MFVMTKAISLSHMAMLRLSGADAESYLQGQLTTDVTQLSDDRVQLSAQCDSKGKTWATFYLFRQSESFYLLGPSGALQISLKELRKYAVFSKVDIEDVTEQYNLIGLQDVSSDFASDFQINASLAQGELYSSDGMFVWRADTSSERHIVVLAKDSDKAVDCDHSDSALSLWKALDAQAGLPLLDEDTSGEFVPQMMNLQALDAVSFTKGCYMGQETIARTKYLGKNKRAGFIVSTEGHPDVSSNEVLEMQLGESWRRGGTLLFSGQDDSLTWGFAVLPNDVEPDVLFRLKRDPDVLWRLSSLPYSLDDSA